MELDGPATKFDTPLPLIILLILGGAILVLSSLFLGAKSLWGYVGGAMLFLGIVMWVFREPKA